MSSHFRGNSLQTLLVTIIGLGVAMYFGSTAGKGESKMFSIVVAAVIAAIIVMSMRGRIWLLIPACWLLGGKITALPIPFGNRDIAIMVVFAGFTMFFVFKIPVAKPRRNYFDVLLGLNLFYLLTVYIRHPVGIQALGTEYVGGRPYAIVAFSFCAYIVLSRVVMKPSQSRLIIYCFVGASILIAGLNLTAHNFPSTVPIIYKFYSGIDVSGYLQEALNTPESAISGRQAFLAVFGMTTILALFSIYRPLSLFLPVNLWRFSVFALALYAMLIAGYRSGIVLLAVYTGFAVYLREGGIKVMVLTMFGLPIIALLLMGQGRLFELPYTAQRALCFLPGDWDSAVKKSADDSSEWRFEIWRRAWEGDSIKSKTFGDGFGFTRVQMQMIAVSNERRGEDFSIDNALISGAYHSGPLSAVRYVGIVGLVLFTALMVAMSFYAFRLIRRAENTPFYALALFVGIPIIFQPFNYWVIFGGYDGDFPEAIFRLGMLKVLSNALIAHKRAEAPVTEVATEIRPHAPGRWLGAPMPAGAARIGPPLGFAGPVPGTSTGRANLRPG